MRMIHIFSMLKIKLFCDRIVANLLVLLRKYVSDKLKF